DNPLDIRYFDIDDMTPVIANKQSAHIVWGYDAHGNIVDEKLFGIHDEPVALDGVHHTVMQRDRNGRTRREDHWGPGEPTKKRSAVEFRYNDWGNKIEERHLDANDQPVLFVVGKGCGTTKWQYSDRQELLEEKCVGPGDTLVPGLRYGAAHIKYIYGHLGEK